MRAWPATLLPVAAVATMAPPATAESFLDTKPGAMVFTVPAGVTSLSLSATGGAGGDVKSSNGTVLVPGGQGALVSGRVTVRPGERLQLTVATSGHSADSSTGVRGAGGVPDGGAGGYSAAGGGGVTQVFHCSGVVCDVGVVAAGGGGAGMEGIYGTGTLAGGPGGGAGQAGSSGTGVAPITGGSGGQPGATMPGTGGPGGTGGLGSSQSGTDATGSTGGAGGGQSTFQEGGGGGGGGVYGGGGGGSGTYGQDVSMNGVRSAGGGGGGGSSLPPAHGTAVLAKRGAAPAIRLTWTPHLAAVTRLTLSPSAFPAAPSGPSVLAAGRRYGTNVMYVLNEAASVRFTVVQSQPGRLGRGGQCVKPTPANRRARGCTLIVRTLGSFTRPGVDGANSFRFSGRLAGHKLAPGRYQLMAIPSAGGRRGRSASAAFRITA